ncbi:MAG: hypothetical protein KGM99_06775 [Burkholderiales bacterium]|nr:hypothetical protein [Burkholderiales bacterium]
MNRIFAKTSKGREEVSQRSAGLSAKQRSILIMLDGSKKLSALTTPVPHNELAEIVDFLRQQELIETASAAIAERPSNTAALTHSTIPANTPAVPATDRVLPATTGNHAAHKDLVRETWITDDASIRKLKDFMTVTAQTYLGLLAADVIRRIELAKDARQLMGVLGHWHMALRDSKQGHRFASVYMEQISAALHGKEATLPGI